MDTNEHQTSALYTQDLVTECMQLCSQCLIFAMSVEELLAVLSCEQEMVGRFWKNERVWPQRWERKGCFWIKDMEKKRHKATAEFSVLLIYTTLEPTV